MRLCVLSSLAASGPDPYVHCCDPDLARFLPEHHVEYRLIHKHTADAEVAALADEGFDVFINMCDGAPDQDIAGIEVVHALERLGLPYTGADPGFYGVTRERTKAVCRELGLPTPAHVFASDPAEVERAGEELCFPLFVKHHDSYASVGLGPRSRVETRTALRAEAGRMLARFGRILIEEFIEGDEISAMVLDHPDDPERLTLLRPVRIDLPRGESFIHYALKNEGRSTLRWTPVEDEALIARIERVVCPLFRGLGGRDYGRCDLRMNREGELFVLEMNANCAIFCVPGTSDYPSIGDAILLGSELGPAGFLAHILRAALSRAG